jgi:HprK-related kinase A
MRAAAWPSRKVRVGPFSFLLRSPLREVVAAADRLYRDYPACPPDDIVDYSVSVLPPSRLRGWVRPKLVLACDIEIPLMAPVPRAHGLLALEMGMNLQLAVGMTRLLLLHAASLERGGGALIMTADSGSGKSTLAATLGYSGWRFMGDEFVLIDPLDAMLRPFPRPISLKNESIGLLAGAAPADRFGPRFDDTIKGTVQHLAPPVEAIAAMDSPAPPRLIVMPAFSPGSEPTARRLGQAETFVRLSRASTNYRKLGEAGFGLLSRIATTVPAYEIGYGSTDAARAIVEGLWADHG